MSAVFSKVLDMSLTASFVILVVLLVRFFLRKSPKVISYALWTVVLFRLLCPLSLNAPVSVLEVTQPKVTARTAETSYVSYLPESFVAAAPSSKVVAAVEKEPAPIAPAAEEDKHVNTWNWLTIASWIWLAGACVMIVHSMVSYQRLRRCLTEASRIAPRVFLADGIPTPFVMGILRPEIYLPSDTSIKEQEYILAHERHHIRRGDHVMKLLAYAALCMHWFNPLVWVSFFLASKDMEMSCDEAVIRKLGPDIRADYAQTLINLASNRPIIAGMPLAFGEGDTKSRVKNMVKWKQPKTWVFLLSAVVCIVIVVVCAVNPRDDKQSQGEVSIGMKLPRNISALEFGNEKRKFFATEPIDDEIANQQIIPASVLGGIEVHSTGDQALKEKDPSALAKELNWEESAHSTDPLETVSWNTPYGEMEASRDNILRNYYQIGTKTYEVWFDMTLIDETTRCSILESVYFAPDAQIEENMPEVIIHLPAKVMIGMKIPFDLEPVSLENEIQFRPVNLENREVSETPWGGVKIYPAPDDSLYMSGMDDWLQELGVPQILDGLHDWMASSSPDADLEVSFADAGGRETKHYYFAKEESVFELWFDARYFDAMTQAAVLGSVSFAPDAGIEKSLPMMQTELYAGMAADAQQKEEEIYLEQCRDVLLALQGEESYSIKIQRSNYGGPILNDTSTAWYYQNGSDWLLMYSIPVDGILDGVPVWEDKWGYMQVDGVRYDNAENPALDENRQVHWSKAKTVEEKNVWFADFRWDAQDVNFVSKMAAGKGMCITMQAMATYYGNVEGEYPYYQMQFFFDEKGEFSRVENTIFFNDETAGDYSSKEIIQVSTDSAEEIIQYEYQRYLKGM